jgi:hypothetical protein
VRTINAQLFPSLTHPDSDQFMAFLKHHCLHRTPLQLQSTEHKKNNKSSKRQINRISEMRA